MSQAQRLSISSAPCAFHLGRFAQFHRHAHVLKGGQRREQVVGLKDEADVAADFYELARGELPSSRDSAWHVGRGQRFHLHRSALLDRSQTADERQQRGFSRAWGRS